MTILKADYYDGKTWTRHPVSLVLAGRTMKIIGESVELQADLRRVRRSLRIGDTPRWLYLPGGGACVTDDNGAVDRITRKRRYDRLLQHWEARPALAALAVAIVAICTWLLVTEALPVVADEVASRIPVEAEAVLGRQTLEGMDRVVLRPSQLPQARQAELAEKLRSMMHAAKDSTAYRLEFRSSPALGANAFALPSGIIIVLDDLVKLARRDDEVLGVLAHEIGHVHHRHTMRRLLEGSATALLLAALTGDIASTTSLAAAAPTLLLQTKYSRDNEREADAYGVQLMKNAGLDGRALAVMLGRLERRQVGRRSAFMPTFLSSHPATDERKAAVLAAMGTSGEGPAGEPSGETKAMRLPAREDSLADVALPDFKDAVDMDRQLIALLKSRQFARLDEVLHGIQRKYEADPSLEPQADAAWSAFERTSEEFEILLDAWVTEMPDSYAAHLARGVRYKHVAATRWKRSARQPPSAAYLQRASEELDKAYALHPRLLHAIAAKIWVALFLGDEEELARLKATALRINPSTVSARWNYLWSLMPRWGGSREAMAAEIASIRPDYATNEHLRVLEGLIDADKGDDAIYRGDYRACAQHFTQALSYGKRSYYYLRRADCMFSLSRRDEAKADVESSLLLWPSEHRALYIRGFFAYQESRWDDALRDLSAAIESDGEEAKYWDVRGEVNRLKSKRYSAYMDFKKAVELEPGNPEYQEDLKKLLSSGTPGPEEG